MPLTQDQLDTLKLFLDGDEDDADALFFEKLFSEISNLRDQARAILGVHQYYTEANNLAALQGIKAEITMKVNQLATLLT